MYNSKINGYNLTDGGEGVQGYQHTNATKLKISKSQKKNNHKKKTEQINAWTKAHREDHSIMMKTRWENESFKADMSKKHKKKVLCITTGKIFNSVNEAAEYANVSPSSISKCLTGIQKTAGKHPTLKTKLQWKYFTD